MSDPYRNMPVRHTAPHIEQDLHRMEAVPKWTDWFIINQKQYPEFTPFILCLQTLREFILFDWVNSGYCQPQQLQCVGADRKSGVAFPPALQKNGQIWSSCCTGSLVAKSLFAAPNWLQLGTSPRQLGRTLCRRQLSLIQCCTWCRQASFFLAIMKHCSELPDSAATANFLDALALTKQNSEANLPPPWNPC